MLVALEKQQQTALSDLEQEPVRPLRQGVGRWHSPMEPCDHPAPQLENS